MKRIGLIAALVLVACMVPAGIYAMQNAPDPADKAGDAAMKFLKSSATYAFDGSASSVRVVDVRSLGGEPAQFEVELEFDSMHGGYGDRTSMMVTQAITPHTMTVKVVGGEVAEAVTDGRWDEIGQEAEPAVMPPLVTPISSEEARNAALDYIFGAYGVSAPEGSGSSTT